MIVPVTAENEDVWAAMSAALYGCDPQTLLAERAAGRLPHEFLYRLPDGGEAGLLSLSVRFDYVEGTDAPPVGYLEGLYVRPDCRLRGIAREMIAYARRWSVEQGCTTLASDCILTNTDSERFHKSVGFAEVNRLICFTMELDKGEQP